MFIWGNVEYMIYNWLNESVEARINCHDIKVKDDFKHLVAQVFLHMLNSREFQENKDTIQSFLNGIGENIQWRGRAIYTEEWIKRAK